MEVKKNLDWGKIILESVIISIISSAVAVVVSLIGIIRTTSKTRMELSHGHSDLSHEHSDLSRGHNELSEKLSTIQETATFLKEEEQNRRSVEQALHSNGITVGNVILQLQSMEAKIAKLLEENNRLRDEVQYLRQSQAIKSAYRNSSASYEADDEYERER